MSMNRYGRRRRHGGTIADLLVAATLLGMLITTLMTLTVQSGRLRQQTRQQQLALDELTNQLQRLLALDEDKRTSSLENLESSEEIKSTLPPFILHAEEIDDEEGKWMQLTLTWQPPRNSPPVSLVGWIDSSKQKEQD